jgi:hypothetical protein
VNRRVRLLVLLSLAGIVACSQKPPSPGIDQASPTTQDDSRAAVDPRLAGSYRFERDGWIFVHLQGPPATLGFQHGYLLADEIADLLRVVSAFDEHKTKRPWSFYRETAEKMLWPRIETEYREELQGIVAGLLARRKQADLWDIVALNAFEELPDYYVPWLDAQQGRTPGKNHGSCSAFVATGTWTKDRRIVMGHNAWTNYAVGARWNIVFDLVPEKGYRMFMDGLPGVIVSDDDFGINGHGLMVTETTITGFHGFDPNGIAEFVRARKALQYAASIDDYVRIMLEGNNGGYANDWLLGDRTTGEIARFELGLKTHSVERTKDGYYVGSNFPSNPELIATETDFDPKKADSSPNARRARWEQLMAEHKGAIDAELGKRFEADGYDAFAKQDGPNERSLCGLVDTSPRGIPEWDWGPFYPGGTVQAKVTTSAMAEGLRFLAAMGHPCAPGFVAKTYLAAHPEYAWASGLLVDMPTRPWTEFAAGMRP